MSTELTIDRLVPGGAGLAREATGPHAGRVVFVAGTAPGDRVEVAVTRARRRWAEARLVRVVEPGPARAAPFCPLAERCGGCAWQHVAPDAQAAARAGFVADALRRVPRAAGGPGVAPRPVAAGGREGHRARVRLHLRGRKGDPQIGFHAARSHDIVEVVRCPVATPSVNDAIALLRGRLPRAVAFAGSAVLLSGDSGPAALSLRIQGGTIEGPTFPDHVLRTVPTADGAGVALRVSAGAFAQAHAEGNRALVRALLDRWSDLPGDPERTVELYAGGGNLTIPLALAGSRVVAVERAPDAVADLRANAAAAGVERLVDVWEEDTGAPTVAARLAAERPERIVLDPPREGARDVLSAVALAAPRSIVYVSCDPMTLGRDLEILAAHGYGLWEALPFDLFPETPHVETLSILVRVTGPAGQPGTAGL